MARLFVAVWPAPEQWLVKLRPNGQVADRSSPRGVRFEGLASFPLEC